MVKKESDLLSLEKGSSRRKWKDKTPVALLFPNTYHLGMSNLGFQLVFDLLAAIPDVVCERVFYPTNNGQPLSVESGRTLQSFPVILCSMSFEEDFPNLLKMLRLADIEPLAQKRRSEPVGAGKAPLIIAGGVATFINPEPLASYIDMFVVGEAEGVLPGLMEFVLSRSGRGERQDFLFESAKRFSNCYVPSLYSVAYNNDGTIQSYSATAGIPERVSRSVLYSASQVGHTRILSPATEFADLFLAELGRGCSRGCRFCAAGFVYRPPRLWPAEAILAVLAQRPLEAAGVGLLGMEMAKRQDLQKIARFLADESCRLSFSSLRADNIGPELVRLLEKSGLKSAAIAPDGGSERLRKVINKGITEEDVLHASEILVRAGIRNLKLYFMIGLPTESFEDLEELVSLTLAVKKKVLAVGKARGRLSNMTLSVNCFVPKAWTPFQYHPFAAIHELKGKIKYLKKSFAGHANIRMTAGSPDKAFFQAMLARGDRKVGRVLLDVIDRGRNWKHVYKDRGVDPGFYASRQRGRDELFPWEIIDQGISRKFLWLEYRKGLKGVRTTNCDTSRCKRCGVCGDNQEKKEKRQA